MTIKDRIYREEEIKEVLVSDIDGVLVELNIDLNNFYNKTYGTNFRLEDYIHYDLEKVWRVNKKRAVEIVTEFYFSSDFNKIKPTEFSQDAIRYLSKKYNIIIITSRPNFMKKKTEEWAFKNYPDIKEIFYTGDYYKNSTEMSKLNICLREKAGIIVDDHPLIIKECAQHGIVSFLFGRGNNLKEKPERMDGIISVNDWKEILNYLNINHSCAIK